METIYCQDRLNPLNPKEFIQVERARHIGKPADWPQSLGMV